MSDYDDWRERRDAARASWRAVNGMEDEPVGIRPPLFLIAFIGVMGVLALYVFVLGGGL